MSERIKEPEDRTGSSRTGRAANRRALARIRPVSSRTERRASENYSIAIPPPNVTGSLHMGHALNGSVGDTLIRYNRMKSQIKSPPTRTKWIFGTDHAGIATQAQVEKALLARAYVTSWGVKRSWSACGSGERTTRHHRRAFQAASPRAGHRRAFYARRGLRPCGRQVFINLYPEGLGLPRSLHRQLGSGSRSAISDLEGRRAPRDRHALLDSL